jgi:hypothetical protein
MTEVSFDADSPDDITGQGFSFDNPVNARICKEPDCDNPLAPDAHAFARYCPEDAPDKAKPAGKRGRPRKDTPPKIVFEVNSKGGTENAQVQRITKGAAAYFKMAAGGVAMMGDETCADAIAKGIPQMAAAFGELSKYQPWVGKFFAPISASDQTAAWLGVAVASAPILIPVLAHHGILPEKIGVILGGVMVGATEGVAE